MERGVDAFVKVLTKWPAATANLFNFFLLRIFKIFFFSGIESLPGVQAEDPVAQIFMGRSADCPQYGVQDDHDHDDDDDDNDDDDDDDALNKDCQLSTIRSSI